MNFEQHVIDSLARLEAQMETLVGNGQPGRIAKIEKQVLLLTIGGVIMAVAMWGPLAVAAFLK